VKLTDYVYSLPDELIAQEPSNLRDKSKLMVLDRKTEVTEELFFSDIVKFFRPGDVLVLNDTQVIPARLLGNRENGGKIEVFLLKYLDQKRWRCLVKPGSKLKIGTIFKIGEICGQILERGLDGERIVEFDASPEEVLKIGNIPLPPYIHNNKVDRDRYQTVFASRPGAVAAPTAGLHFTKELLKILEINGVQIVKITLHVGLGTFRPIHCEDIDKHRMEFEWFEIPKDVAQTINLTRKSNGEVFACGTTTVRTLESSSTPDGEVLASSGETNLFIKPGYKFKVVDHLITNFHLPGSTLLLLVSAFASRNQILSTYELAIRKQFRFFSFGDAMLIL